MPGAIRFGTDGWRGVIAEDFTFANVRACAAGVARYLQRHQGARRGLVVGYDTRFASEDFASAVAEVACACGVPTLLCDRPAPTPAIGYQILFRQAAGAVVITASHNPARWNGFKVRPEYAGSAPPEVLAQIEAEIGRVLKEGPPPRLPLEQALARGLLTRVDPSTPYVEQLARLVDLKALRGAGLRVVVDAMHGAGAGYLPGLLAGGPTSVAEIRSERNPLFPGMAQPEPVPRNLEPLRQEVLRTGAQVGLALDGDADRLGVVDERGRFLTTLEVFALLAYYLLGVRGLRGPIVKTVTTSRMMFLLGQRYGVPVFETPVGFKFVGPVMMREGAVIGGEESGGYAFRGHLPERDGILSALYFLDLMVRTGKTPSLLVEELFSLVGPHHFRRLDIPFPPEMRGEVLGRVSSARPDALAGLRVTGRDTLDGLRFHLEGGAWLVVRASGTEPLLRIYAEAPTPEGVEALLQAGRELAGL